MRELALPPEVEALSSLGRGLVLIGGATGAGKTTTMAALVDEINRRDARHIITVEDPIEYEHLHERSLVEQVEIGPDAPDFPTALRSAVRQAPDVLVIGEMRDHESMRIALSAAETGHLVFSSLHTTDIASTIARICDSFPNERQNTIRQELSLALSAVMTQTLVPKIGGGRVPAVELLMVSYGARQHIRKNALQHLHQEMSLTRKQGSLTLEDSLGAAGEGGPDHGSRRRGPRGTSRRARKHSAGLGATKARRATKAQFLSSSRRRRSRSVPRGLSLAFSLSPYLVPRFPSAIAGGSRPRRARRRRGARRRTSGAGTRHPSDSSDRLGRVVAAAGSAK